MHRMKDSCRAEGKSMKFVILCLPKTRNRLIREHQPTSNCDHMIVDRLPLAQEHPYTYSGTNAQQTSEHSSGCSTTESESQKYILARYVRARLSATGEKRRGDKEREKTRNEANTRSAQSTQRTELIETYEAHLIANNMGQENYKRFSLRFAVEPSRRS